MADALDAPSILKMVDREGLETTYGQLTPSAQARV
eukprot:COSAG02_NODE_49793_length_324_cov_1.377778_1_plen_34_part_10